MTAAVDLYYWPTPNGWKISIMLEETGLPYNVLPVDIGGGDQFKPEFLRISPNNKMPAIVDPQGPGGESISIFESGAILIYLADKTNQFFSTEPRTRYRVLEWLMFQVGGIGPLLGQAHHFRHYAPEQIEYAVNRYTNEARRLYNVLDTRLTDCEFVAGEYSIADIATFPWIVSYERQGQDLDQFPNVKRWFEAIESRPAVRRGLDVLKEQRRTQPFDEEAREILFGSKQYERHT